MKPYDALKTAAERLRSMARFVSPNTATLNLARDCEQAAAQFVELVVENEALHKRVAELDQREESRALWHERAKTARAEGYAACEADVVARFLPGTLGSDIQQIIERGEHRGAAARKAES